MFNKLLPQLYQQIWLLSINRKILQSTIGSKRYYFPREKTAREIRSETTRDFTEGLTVHIMGNGAIGNARAVMISCDNTLYLFNCGEGTHRLLQQHRMRKIHHIFFTSNDWRNVCGLSSILMYLNDCNVTDVSVHGFACRQMKEFCCNFDVKLKFNKYNYYGCNSGESDIKQFDGNYVSIRSVTIVSNNSVCVAYVCKFPRKPGVLDMDKCWNLRIPRDFLKQLVARQTVTLEDGRVVTPEEVHSADEPERVVVILECPTIEFIDALISDENLLNELKLNKDSIDCVVHITADECVNDRLYQQFIENYFSSSTQHLVINETNPNYCMQEIHRFQSQLNYIDNKLFPLLKEKIELHRKILQYNDKTSDNIVRCQSSLNFVLRPNNFYGYSFNNISDIDITRFQEYSLRSFDGNERPNIEQFRESIKHLREKQKRIDKSVRTSDFLYYPEVVFLGTGAANQGIVRNVSGILVNTSPDSSILMDCGENTFGQLCRFYGIDNVGRALRKLKAVFITHTHSDHHLGLITLIKKYFAQTNRKLPIFLPHELSLWLDRYCAHYENISAFYKSIYTDYLEYVKEEDLKRMKLSRFTTVPVLHMFNSRALVITTLNNITIAYSGDAEPSDTLIESGRNCDLLIHDATVEDSMVDFARNSFHSTFSEAIDVGRRMNAKFTLLTHFSQRYGKLPLIPDDTSDKIKFGVSFDFLRVSVPQDLQRLPIILPSLKLFYSTHYESIVTRGGLRRLRLDSKQEYHKSN